MTTILLSVIFLPLVAGICAIIFPRRLRPVARIFTLAASALDLLLAGLLLGKNFNFTLPWLGLGLDFSLRLDLFSGFIVFAAAFLAFLTVLYSVSFMRDRESPAQFYAYLLFSLALVNGALLADNLVLLLFFWEALLIVLFGFIRIGRPQAWRTAIKAFVITGVADLCMMVGIVIAASLSGTLNISKILLSPDSTLAVLAFILLSAGALAKVGAIPFHTWIPDAAEDAPVSFMALMPASLDKLLGIYFLVRVSHEMYRLQAGSALSVILMSIGAVTIILGVMLALVQKNYKKLLAYHAISQAGYMVLGVGTCLPVGIIGGIFHMLNNAVYKCGLFLTSGAVERQAGSADLEKLGGLAKFMPVTFICFTVMALSISGVPPFNGFFSKELLYDAALKQGFIFYLAAIVGSFLTAASFLKLGHSAYLGQRRSETQDVKEAPPAMLAPMVAIAATCIFLGLGSHYVVSSWIMPIVANTASVEHLPGPNVMLIAVTLLVLAGALIHHCLRVKVTGDALKSADDIHYAPVVRNVYTASEKKYFDPYEAGLVFIKIFSHIFSWVDKAIDWVYNFAVPGISFFVYRRISAAHSGYYVVYIVWALVGSLAAGMFLLK